MSDKGRVLPIGTVLTNGQMQYTIESVIGSGGFGITYRGRTQVKVGNITAQISVAIKELFVSADCERVVSADGETTVITSGPARARFEAAKKDFLAEARRLSGLCGASRNIVNVNEVFAANGTAYYVMEYLEGSTLRDYVRQRGKLSENETLMLLEPLMDAVSLLHSRRIMHLDIKPSNVMVTKDDSGSLRPVLIDFGQSKHYDAEGEVTNTVSAAGLSEGYAPVEQYAGIKSFSPQTDVYSLAATTLFCLTGQKPPRAMELTADYVKGSLSRDVSEEVRKAIVAALEMQPAKRTQSVDAFRSALADDKTIIVPPTPPTPKPAGNGLLWVVVAVLLVALGVVGALIYNRENSKENVAPAPTPAIYAPEVEEVPDSSVAEVEPAAEEEAYDGVPVMNTEELSGWFEDSRGQQWPVRLKFTTNGAGEFYDCVYTNVTYGIVLNMTGSGSDGSYTFYTNEQGADLTIRIHRSGSGWSGTATSGSKTLDVYLE